MGFGLAIWFGSVHWNGKTSKFVEKLIQTPPRGNLKKVSFKDIEQLPAPVVKYFQLALNEGQPLIHTAYIVQAGEFRSQTSDNGWGPFEARQCFSTLSPGFVWDASISMAPLMKVRVRDSYIAGQGSMQVPCSAT